MIHDTAHTLLHKALEIIRVASSGHPFPTRAALARATGESEANISRWLSGAATPTLKKLEPILMRLGVRLSLPAEQNPPPLVIHAPPTTPGDIPLTFRAVIMLGETGLSSLSSYPSPEWLLARSSDVGKDSVALRVALHDRSMLPTLHPGDIAFIDRASSTSPTSQDICLVQAPPSEFAESATSGISGTSGETDKTGAMGERGTPTISGGWLLRRVCLKNQRNDMQIIFYADNAREGFTPETYSLSQYPGSSLTEAIHGKVTHIWADVRKR